MKNNINATVTAENATAAVATAATAATVRVLSENLAGKTLDGVLETNIKRHTLKGESKCAMVKRLLMTAGMTKEKLVALVDAAHSATSGLLKDSTLNTIRADLKRTLGTGDIACTGWRTDGKQGKLATAAVAKLRTHALGVSAFTAGLITSSATQATAAVAEQAGAELANAESNGSSEEQAAIVTGDTVQASEQVTEKKAGKQRNKRKGKK